MPSPLKPKALNIFIVAEQFRFAGKMAILIPVVSKNIPLMRPLYDEQINAKTAAAVCSSFALELYLKCLIRIGRKSYGRKHDLRALFNLVGIKNRAKIKRYWNSNSESVRKYVHSTFEGDPMDTPKVDFDFALDASRDAFVLMRYIFENGIPPQSGWLGDAIVEGARHAILEMHPQWEYARQASPMGEVSLPATFLTR